MSKHQLEDEEQDQQSAHKTSNQPHLLVISSVEQLPIYMTNHTILDAHVHEKRTGIFKAQPHLLLPLEWQIQRSEPLPPWWASWWDCHASIA